MIYLIILPLFWSCESTISTGLDSLKSTDFEPLQHKNIGLIINHTSIDKDGNHIIELLANEPGINVVKIFSPEHGYKGTHAAGELVNDDVEPLTGAKIVSLYGVNKKPSREELDDIDVLVYDIQDIGSRYYTYISTMAYMMDVAAENKIPFIVLDRPNPLGRKVSGPILDVEYASFVGMFPIPIRHGMTSGELAKMINGENWLPSGKQVDLSVIKLSGWDLDAGYFSIAPSPNIPNYITALVYSGMCLLEGTNISEGRGTDYPFIYFGAPWINGTQLRDTLNNLKLDGIRFDSVKFTPVTSERSKWPKYEKKECSGCKIIVLDSKSYNPIKTAIQVILTISELYPEKFEFLNTNFIDKLYGSKMLRLWVKSQNNTIDLYQKWESQFPLLREQYLIY
ncbi:MAG: DUF1343 domain-containing protein [Candidatus Marinimicrobia bacterium]|nr:DUF1343 domain-containing protein [Candidatus Neomarinimicrobiota bacterium]